MRGYPRHETGFGSRHAAQAARFRELGGFDPSFPFAAGEDRDLCDRWLAAGGRMVYAPQAQVQHSHALTLGAFWRQQFNYGRGACRFHRLRAGLEARSFYVQLLLHPLRERGLPTREVMLAVGLMLRSQAAVTTGFAWERRRAG